ncbi:DUF3592 domain-containing protein [Hymenobacter actinosclerus]|uniref:DUF3592 domain-containing protein n=1 Tax=Hymenobacter actinosclerus TaxID=82805 RepID=UPI000B853F15|nr:DUF3592 domain-containing protein [Hymenobacter actinosclerus]
MDIEIKVFLGAFGLVVMAVIIFAYLKAKRHYDRMQQHGLRANGVVVRNKISWGQNTTVRPIVRFVTQDGQPIEGLSTAGVAFAMPRYPQGAKVALLYDPENPHDFTIESADRSYI